MSKIVQWHCPVLITPILTVLLICFNFFNFMCNCEYVSVSVCACGRVRARAYAHLGVAIMHGHLRHYFHDGDGAVLQSWACMYRSSAPVMDLHVSIGLVLRTWTCMYRSSAPVMDLYV